MLTKHTVAAGRHWVAAGFLLLVFVFCVRSTSSQTNSGTIRGTAFDASGAIVPHAQVTVRNVETNAINNTATNDVGEYQFQFLPPGTYRVDGEASGFKRFSRDNIQLAVAADVRVDITLELGAVSETITVTDQAPTLETDSGALNTSVQSNLLTSLPLSTRTAGALMELAPGTTGGSGSGVVGNGMMPSTNGGAARSDPFFIDGVNSTNQVIGNATINPNPDILKEVSVLTNSYSAEYGDTSGAVLVAVTKSGSNQFHGSAFEFVQNNILNASNWFSHTVPHQRYNQFGGTFGGPIDRDKTYFFADMQFTKNPSTTVQTGLTLPINAYRSGDFSSRLTTNIIGTDALGRNVFAGEIFNPFSERLVPSPITTGPAMVWVRDPFPTANVVPSGMITSVASKLQALFPTVATNSPSANFGASPRTLNNETSADLRLDHNFSPSDQINGRYSNRRYESRGAATLGPLAGGSAGGDYKGSADQATINWIHVRGSNATNDLVVSWNYQFPKRDAAGQGMPGTLNSNFGLTGLPTFTQQGLPVPQIAFGGGSGILTLGSTADILYREKQVSYGLTDAYSWSHRRHSFKFGGMYRHIFTSNFQPGAYGLGGVGTGGGETGTFSFNTLMTNQPAVFNAAQNKTVSSSSTGFDYAAFLLGVPTSVTWNIFPSYFRASAGYYALFAQDDFRVNNRLTLNLGLRWDIPLYYHEEENRSGTYVPSAGQYVQFGTGGFRTTQWNNAILNFDPRIGFAYSLAPKTIVRGGYGIFTIGTTNLGPFGSLQTYPIFADNDVGRFASVDGVTYPYAPGAAITSPLLANVPYSPASKTGTNASLVVTAPNNQKQAYMQQWNMNVQDEFFGTVFQVGYAGSRGLYLPADASSNSGLAYNENAVPLALAPTDQGRFLPGDVPFPQFRGGVFVSEWIGSSSYNSFQATVQRRLHNGLSLLGTYTHASNISCGNLGYRAPVDNRKLDCGPAAVAPDRMVVAATYQLPFGSGRHWLAKGIIGNLAGGWDLNALTTFQNGAFLTPTLATNNCSCGNAWGAPNVVGDPYAGFTRTLNANFNTAAFAAPSNFTIGNARIGMLRGNHVSTTDVNAQKNFSLPREGMSIQFRAELYNVFNHPVFGNPTTAFGTPTFGRVLASSNQRAAQFGLKLLF